MQMGLKEQLIVELLYMTYMTIGQHSIEYHYVPNRNITLKDNPESNDTSILFYRTIHIFPHFLLVSNQPADKLTDRKRFTTQATEPN